MRFIGLGFAILMSAFTTPLFADEAAPAVVDDIQPERPNLRADTSLFAQASRFDYPATGVLIGQGWNSLTAAGSPGTCVDIQVAPIESATFAVEVEEIKSRYSLLKSQSVFVQAGGSFGGFSGDASYESSRSREINSDYINVFFEVTSERGSSQAVGRSVDSDTALLEFVATNGLSDLSPEAQQIALTRFLSNPPTVSGAEIRLSAFAAELLKADPLAFRMTCGDGFVSAVHRGSATQIVATYESSSVSEQESFKAALSAGGFGFKASYGSSGTTELSEFDSAMRYSIFQRGGIPQTVPPSLGALKELLSNADAFAANPIAHAVSVSSYSSLASYREISQSNSGFDPERLSRLSAQYLLLSDVYALVDHVYVEHLLDEGARQFNKDVVEAYGGLDHLQALRNDIEADMLFLERSISNCYSYRPSCSEIAAKANFGNYAKQIAALTLELNNEVPTRNSGLDASNQISFSRQLENLSEAEKTAILSRSAASLTEENQRIARTTGALGPEDEPISDSFYLRFYDFLLRTPLSNASTPATLDFPDAATLTTEEARSAAQEKVNSAVRTAILTQRLLPWKNYFCDQSFSNVLCVSDAYFERLLTDQLVAVAGTGIVVVREVCEDVEIFSRREMVEQCYDQVADGQIGDRYYYFSHPCEGETAWVERQCRKIPVAE